MVKVKICGIKKKEEILFLNQLQPDYLGFVFAESKRRISVEQAKELISLMDKNIKSVGVFVNADLDFVRRVVEEAGIDVVQLHGDEDQDYIDQIKSIEVWKAIGVSDSGFNEKIEDYRIDKILLDTAVKGVRGGSGKTFDWQLAKEVAKERDIILAGGLNPENVAEAISIVNPYGVDISSGVEDEFGKNYNKCKKFIEEVRKI